MQMIKLIQLNQRLNILSKLKPLTEIQMNCIVLLRNGQMPNLSQIFLDLSLYQFWEILGDSFPALVMCTRKLHAIVNEYVV